MATTKTEQDSELSSVWFITLFIIHIGSLERFQHHGQRPCWSHLRTACFCSLPTWWNTEMFQGQDYFMWALTHHWQKLKRFIETQQTRTLRSNLKKKIFNIFTFLEMIGCLSVLCGLCCSASLLLPAAGLVWSGRPRCAAARFNSLWIWLSIKKSGMIRTQHRFAVALRCTFQPSNHSNESESDAGISLFLKSYRHPRWMNELLTKLFFLKETILSQCGNFILFRCKIIRTSFHSCSLRKLITHVQKFSAKLGH